MDTAAFIQSVSFFTKLDHEQLQILLKKFQRRHHRRNEVIFPQGDPADHMHIILEGRIRISVASDDGREMSLALLQPGDFFGEMALLDNSNRSATATAIVPSETIVLFRQDFLEFLTARDRAVQGSR